jgi:hypothetical protein
MDDSTAPPPPGYLRVPAPRCPECERTTTTRLEHLIHGDVITSNWICTCGASWPADGDLAPRKAAEDTRRSADAIILGDLRHLIAALDRRLPNGDAGRERVVAGLSATLREQAVERIARLESAPPDSPDHHLPENDGPKC